MELFLLIWIICGLFTSGLVLPEINDGKIKLELSVNFTIFVIILLSWPAFLGVFLYSKGK